MRDHLTDTPPYSHTVVILTASPTYKELVLMVAFTEVICSPRLDARAGDLELTD